MSLDGTPKNLDEALALANNDKEAAYVIIKDFIANRLQAFMFNANKQEEKLISDIFESIVKR